VPPVFACLGACAFFYNRTVQYSLCSIVVGTGTRFPEHRLEPAAETGRSSDKWSGRPTQLSPQPRAVFDDPVRYVGVCLDDLIGVVQGDVDDLTQLRRAALHNLDRVFRPLEPGDDPHRRGPTSLKRLLQGDGLLTARETVLGWALDCALCTLESTGRRRLRLDEPLSESPHTRERVSTKKWQGVLGELRSMSIALPGSRGLSGPLQAALRPGQRRLHLTKGAHDSLDDFRWLTSRLSERPTRLFELVPGEPAVLGSWKVFKPTSPSQGVGARR